MQNNNTEFNEKDKTFDGIIDNDSKRNKILIFLWGITVGVIIVTLINIGVSILFCYLWGVIGVVLGTTISLVVCNGIIMNIYYHKVIKLNILRFWFEIMKIIPAIILPIACGVLIMLGGITTDLQFVLSVIVYVMVYVLSMYLFGLNKDEKTKVKMLFTRKKG